MYYPTLEQVKQSAGSANLVPIHREVTADLETPVSAYLKVAKPPYSFLLESVEGGEHIGRYSFIGTEPTKVFKTGEGEEYGAVDPLIPIEEELSKYRLAEFPDSERFNGGAVGYVSYDAVRYFERLPTPDHDPTGVPESIFMLTSTFVVFDHLRHRIRVVSHAFLDGDVDAAYAAAVERIDEIVARLEGPLQMPKASTGAGVKGAETEMNMTSEYYNDMVAKTREYIIDGDVIQTVVGQRMGRRTDAHPFQIYRELRAINPSPYMYYLELDGFQVVGASPEMLVQVENGKVAVHPIAGTRRRGKDEAEDLALEEELRTDEKEQAEHIMLLDLGRNDVGRVSKPGTVNVSQIMDIERYSHVIHLVSHVTGELQDGYSNYDALRSCFPAGTVSGAPKIRAMEIVAELEPDKRGVYAGAVGYFDFAGNMDTAIAIRTLIVKDGYAYAQAGGGIVYDSTAENEYMETIHKVTATLRAIDQAEQAME
ncbi:MAG TPA: anthranilate synthase component I [Dehalococcoidia bacterium]|jgi:anthranilate synthase component 1|nr:anthranilate synthase component I [SAR202 cluster bacterium]MQG59090.1 anthranilate synthase component I [SAR202 cluster bacterium]HAL48302.1 anthranilate synthase component I [Dehalococcoidia bacterium]|tara:strand:- start:1179 stop:2624 length:1446 start_codon:yes stop_codon:yes gene_type:complete